MSQPPGTLYEIRWNEICPWLILVRALRVSLMLRVLAIAFAGVLCTQWGWAAIDRVFASHPADLQRITDTSLKPEVASPPAIPRATDTKRLADFVEHSNAGPLVRGWSWLTKPLLLLVNRETTWQRSWALLLSGAWAIVVWALFGGAITRIAAVQLTRGETLGPLVALRAAATKWGATAGAPLIALLGGAALASPLLLDGLLLRVDFIAMIAGLVWVVILAWGLMLAVVLIGLLLGWPLMWATVGVERTDAFDGVSRCYAYIYQRPLQLVFYVLVATALGLLGEVVVTCFSTAAVMVAEWTISWGAGSRRTAQLVAAPDPASDLGGMLAMAASAIQFWKWTLFAIVASYPVAYLWSAAVGIYLLLRRHIDATEMDEIALDQGEPQQGLPDLSDDGSEVPQVKR